MSWKGFRPSSHAKEAEADMRSRLAALDRSQAVIEFGTDGTILEANANFLTAMGYTRDEVVGRHHRMFVDPVYAASDEYRSFWDGLRAGVFTSAEYRRLAKGGREVWIQASYNPIMDAAGRPKRVVKYATEITAAKLRSADDAGQIEAIEKRHVAGHRRDLRRHRLRTRGRPRSVDGRSGRGPVHNSTGGPQRTPHA